MTQEKTKKEPPEDQLSDYIGKLYHLTYNVKCRSGDVPEIHQIRDAGAFNDIRGPIEQLSYQFIAKFQQQCKADKAITPCEFKFAQHNDARIQSYRTMDGRMHRQPKAEYITLGFFLNLPSMPKFGCRFVNAWAQGGKENAAWCRILRKRFAHWFETPRFSVVWLTFNDVPNYPTTLHYADAASATVIIDYEITEPGGEQSPSFDKRCA